jgi:hypothetical protein
VGWLPAKSIQVGQPTRAGGPKENRGATPLPWHSRWRLVKSGSSRRRGVVGSSTRVGGTHMREKRGWDLTGKALHGGAARSKGDVSARPDEMSLAPAWGSERDWGQARSSWRWCRDQTWLLSGRCLWQRKASVPTSFLGFLMVDGCSGRR